MDNNKEDAAAILHEFLQEPYPTDIFPELSKEQLADIHNTLVSKYGFPLDRLTAHIGRILRKLLKEFAEKFIKQKEDSKANAISFAEWFMSENNSYNKIYHSDCDNDGKWHDEFTDGINRHYFTTEELYKEFEIFMDKQSKS